ncbi:MAG TPA: phosphoenolpyruvate--protein phosphotransferase, partial [Actinomycetota bacterium]
TAGGSVGAHLFEVARSLGVPAVTGVELSGAAEGSLAAIDGDAGTVFVLPLARARTAEAGA